MSTWPKETSSMPSTERSRLTIHDAADGVVVLVGEIDAATAPKLHQCLEHDARAPRPRHDTGDVHGLEWSQSHRDRQPCS